MSDFNTPYSHDPAGGADVARLLEIETFRRALALNTPRLWVTHLIVAINAAVFVLMVVNGVHVLNPEAQDIRAWGGNFAPYTTAGEWWRLVTCAFVHVGIIHIFFNMYVLLATGPLVERLVGNVPFAAMYLFSALAGSVASAAWNPMVVSAGASGAVFGVYGALLGFIVLRRGSIPREVLMSLRSSALAFIGYNVIFGMTVPQIDMAAHLGGLAGGFVCGLVVSQPVSEATRASLLRRAAVVVALGIALVAGSIAALPRQVVPGTALPVHE